ncbi:MAG: hypothetical protein EOO75_00295 [Myxococcales bacterium]|nr:MAG: hypothetical protein EOO75_00295 [Myxococcales bacterium]
MRPTISSERWPLVVIHWPGPVELGDVDAHFDELGRLLESRIGNFVVVVDVSAQTSPPNAVIRARAGERLQGVTARFESRLGGVVYVMPSSFIRGAITAVHWLARVEFPFAAVSTRAEALAWAAARVTARRP